MSKSLTPFLIVFVFWFFGCARNDMPSDHQMLENFHLNESEFERLRNISVKYDRFYSPPMMKQIVQPMSSHIKTKRNWIL